MKLIATMVVLSGIWLLAPAAASADSGSITNVHAAGDGQLEATYTTTSTNCTDFEYCGWFPFATQVASGAPCEANDDLTYVGDFQEDSGTQTGTDTFYPLAESVRLCLYITGPDAVERLVARYDYAPSEGDDVPALTVREAKAVLPRILRRDYGSRFMNRKHFRRSCFRYTTQKVRCKVRWEWRSFRYRGSVTMRNDPADAGSVLYRTNIRRKRMRSNTAPRRTCDANYSGCLRPNASDYDCAGGSGDGPYYTGPVRVLGDDHYDLDRDGDGVACEDD